MKKYLILLIAIPILIIIIGASSFMLIMTVLIPSNSGSDDTGGFCLSDNSSIDNNLWNEHYSKMNHLSEHGDDVINLSKEYGIDPIFMTAIITLETGWGRSEALLTHNNPGGVMNPNSPNSTEFISYQTMKDGLEYVANLIAKYIYEKGHMTIESFGAEYSPVNADGTPVANDPHGTNKDWVPSVTSLVESLGGTPTLCVGGGADVEIIGDKAWVVPSTKRVTDPFSPYWRVTHAGIDVSSGNSLGLPVVSFMDGEVVRSIDYCPQSGWHSSRSNKSPNCFDANGNAIGWGNYVRIDHGNGFETLYAHLSQVNVKVGQKVKAGQLIGSIGDSGHSTAPHLHWETWVNGMKYNPFSFLHEFNLYDEFHHDYNVNGYLYKEKL